MASIKVLEIKENRQLREHKVKLFGEWLYDPRVFHAWFILRKYIVKLGGQLGLIVDERYAVPNTPNSGRYSKEELEEKTNRERRIKQAHHAQRTDEIRKGHSNVIIWALTAITCSLAAVFIIVFMAIVSGKLQI